MRRLITLTALLVRPAAARAAAPSQEAIDLFVGKCASCHSVGAGARVGPDLKGATERRKPDWLKRMIQTPGAMLDSDAEARALVGQFNNVRMPDLGLSDAQVQQLIDLIAHCSANACDLAGKFTPVTSATAADIARGEQIFFGTQALKNGAPGCVSCHAVRGGHEILAGGTLSKDLTAVFARLGDQGLDAALKAPPFLVMNKVFGDAPLTADEAFALRAYLYEANRAQLEPKAASGPWSVPLIAGLSSAAALVAMNAAWSRRLRGVRRGIVHKEVRP